jgi:3-hydroxyacyl-CoA dehydrogenase
MKMPEIKKAAVLGGGVIGSSWATNFLWKGVPVHIYDISEEALKTARVRGNLEYLVGKGILTADKMNIALSLAKYTVNLEEAVKDVQFIQEAALEKYEVKQALLAEVDKYAPADAVFASSTSGLLITEISRNSKYPERCLGAHPYNPPHLIPLVEIGKGEKTGERDRQKGLRLLQISGQRARRAPERGHGLHRQQTLSGPLPRGRRSGDERRLFRRGYRQGDVLWPRSSLCPYGPQHDLPIGRRSIRYPGDIEAHRTLR